MSRQAEDLTQQVTDLEAENNQLRLSQQAMPTQSSANSIAPSGKLTQRQLAHHFGVHESSVGRQKLKETFPEWSQKKDPEGKAWHYDQLLEKFSRELLS